MKAVGYYACLPINDEKSLIDIEIAAPSLTKYDLLVEVKAVSVNPVDIKTRLNAKPQGNDPKILGFDAAGIVREIGDEVQGFQIGDEVYYAGSINRQGSNAQLQAVDHRIVAHKPKSLDFTTAAAMPLTSLTAYEMLFDRLQVQNPVHHGKNAILMVPGAGGVGSITIQIAKALSNITVIATASRPQSRDWALKMGADHVIDHSKALAPQLAEISHPHVATIFSAYDSDLYAAQYANIIAPQGRIGLIDGPKNFDIIPFKAKSVSLHWEFMFTRPIFGTDDIAQQGEILKTIATLIDNGKITPTMGDALSPLNAATLRHAHQMIESGKTIGKIVIENKGC